MNLEDPLDPYTWPMGQFQRQWSWMRQCWVLFISRPDTIHWEWVADLEEVK